MLNDEVNMDILEEFVNLDLMGPKIRVGVVGDAMLDQYYSIKIKRISPEFPIPICSSENESSNDFPGGAANVAYQFKHFNVNANLIAFTDEDADSAFKLKEINTDLCIKIPNKIPRKRRFYSNDFPTYRWDIEQVGYGLMDELDGKCFELYEKAKKVVDTFDVLILSDYDKGVMSNYVNLLISEAPISIVDPKCGNIDRWRGCTIFKPNLQEALNLSGKNSVNEAGLYLLDKLKCKAVVITDDGKGVTVFDGGIHEIKPTQKLLPANSVIGAGDCFSAFMAMALARGINIRQAAEIAWLAGTLYVKKRHNKPICQLDLIGKVILKYPEKYIGKNKRTYKLVFTNGCFDIIHAGHLETLRFAKQQGDKLVVAVNSDDSVRRLKPGRPIVPLIDRIKMLAALEFVDFVVPFYENTPLSMIEKIQPDVLVKGSEHQVEKIVGYGIVKEVLTSPMVEGLSTSILIDKIKSL